MRCWSLVLAVVSIGLVAADKAKPVILSFEKAQVGSLPEGWTAAKTGQGPGSVWKVVEDATAPGGPKVLAQTSAEGPNPLFNLCVADAPSLKDLDLSVAYKAMAGKIDQGGGPMWRYQDANNYYIVRMNPLEDNLRLYKVVGGKRVQLGSVDAKAPAGEWHTIRVVQKGDHIGCYLNGKLLLEKDDSTFQQPGKIGLWTKADAQTRFSEIKVSGR